MDPHLRDARTRGIPFMGSGAVYPMALALLEINPFDIPDTWPRGFALDVGWNRTAALWGALNPANDVLTLYDEHYVGQENPATHANSIIGYGTSGKLRGKWIPGVSDPHANDRSQRDGLKLIEDYRALGLDLEAALNAVDAGVHEVWVRLSTGRLKLFNTLQYFKTEYQLYRRNEKGVIIVRPNRPNHLVDCLRYLVISGIARMKPVPTVATEIPDWGDPFAMSATGWMAS